jgi:hypothetical protein
MLKINKDKKRITPFYGSQKEFHRLVCLQSGTKITPSNYSVQDNISFSFQKLTLNK